jgi:hypothetical protein
MAHLQPFVDIGYQFVFHVVIAKTNNCGLHTLPEEYPSQPFQFSRLSRVIRGYRSDLNLAEAFRHTGRLAFDQSKV